MKNPPLLFLDIECLGLDVESPVWDLGAILLNTNGEVRLGKSIDTQILHDPTEGGRDWVSELPASFQDDYESRYDPTTAVDSYDAITRLATLIMPGTVVCGSNPSFDMERVQRLASFSGITLPWHYHPIDVPTLAHGWLCGRGIQPAPPWKSDFISQACGVDVRDFDRHTAYGDAQWCYALYRKVMS